MQPGEGGRRRHGWGRDRARGWLAAERGRVLLSHTWLESMV